MTMLGAPHLKATPVTLGLLLVACASPHASTLDAFENVLTSQDSATLALTQWCATRHIAARPVIRALPVLGQTVAPPPELRDLLELSADERLGYRNVRLTCGDKTLSLAQNWYVPGRLPEAMNQTLTTSDTPFGKVVGPLGFSRERLASVRGRAPGCPDGTILSQRGLLRLQDGRPISLVVECYTSANLGVQ